MALFGAQKTVLRAIVKTQEKNSGEPAEDVQIAQITNIALSNVRDWFLTLRNGEYVDLIPTQTGYSAYVTEKGRLELDLYKPFSPEDQTVLKSYKALSQGNDMSNQFTEGHALVVGIANYPLVSKLSGSVLKDARDVADVAVHSGVECGSTIQSVAHRDIFRWLSIGPSHDRLLSVILAAQDVS